MDVALLVADVQVERRAGKMGARLEILISLLALFRSCQMLDVRQKTRKSGFLPPSSRPVLDHCFLEALVTLHSIIPTLILVRMGRIGK
jgi:hypothetical protein